MFQLALKQLLHERLRSALTALSIGAAIAVILVLRAFEFGQYVQADKMVMDRGGDLIISQAGIANYVAVRSSLPQLTRQRVEDVEGVATAHPSTGLIVIFDKDGLKTPIFLLVYDTKGGPTHISEGTEIKEGRDIVIDTSLAQKYGFQPGDPMVISDFEFRVSGITSGAATMFMPFAFVTYDGLIDFFLDSEIAPDISTFPLLSFLFVDLKPGVDKEKVRQKIEADVVDADVWMPKELAASDVALGKELFGPIMGMLIIVAYVIGLLVVGLIIYADISNRQRSFGVLKALGFRLTHISLSVFAQTLLLLVVAFPVGVLAATIIAFCIETFAPVYLVPVLDPTGLVNTLLGVVVISILSGLLPLRLIARTDPVIAFQGN